MGGEWGLGAGIGVRVPKLEDNVMDGMWGVLSYFIAIAVISFHLLERESISWTTVPVNYLRGGFRVSFSNKFLGAVPAVKILNCV